MCVINPVAIRVAFGPYYIRLTRKMCIRDRHNFDEIENAISQAKEVKNAPVMIVANSVKGKGVSFMENECGWHGKAPSLEEAAKAKSEITR